MIVKYPLSTEKAIRLMESNNMLVFVVDKKATKAQIKEAVERLYSVKVKKINTSIRSNEKRAFVTFSEETPAIDLATQLGLM